MKRRGFVRLAAGLWPAGRLREALRARGAAGPVLADAALSARGFAPSLLVPMDDAQTNHLKAYGIAYRAIARTGRVEWLLNYRGGSFLLGDDAEARRAATLAGVALEPVGDEQVVAIRGGIEQNNQDAVILERVPRVAIYSPPFAAPWDDAVTMALQYAEIPFTKIWDAEVMAGRLHDFDWLHLHHEDFTGQYSKFYLNYAGAVWLAEMVDANQAMARRLGLPHVPALKKAVARHIRDYVDQGGFLFAMCLATETLELALAAHDVDIAAAFADGTPMDPDASAKMDWTAAMACRDAQLETTPSIPAFSDIDGHQVDYPGRRQPLGAFELFNFSAKIDPVPAMLVQCHRQVIPDFYGLTTSFTRHTLKHSVTVLAEEPGAPWVKYIHGDVGRGTWTYFGGHDPEDPQHQVGDPPTDLSLHPTSPGYRLILNNVLFPAARKRELKT
ncbi:MAG: asparagine synthetase B [Gemmatimonadales bacterium]